MTTDLRARGKPYSGRSTASRRSLPPLQHIDSSHVPREEEYASIEEDADEYAPSPSDLERGEKKASETEGADKRDATGPIPNGDADNTRVLHKHFSQRREFIVTYSGPNDPLNARNWPLYRKAYVTALLGSTTACSQFASSVFSAGTEQISAAFNISDEVCVLITSLFVLGYIPGPIVWGPLSEMYGRKLSVLVPFFIFICFTAGTATAKDAQTLFITRFFAGFFASAPVTNVGGGLGDMFDAKQRASAVVAYSFAVVAGPTLGPLIGSAIATSYLGWRWIGYITVIMSSFVLILDVLFLPETYGPALLTRKATRMRLETGNFALHSKHEEQDFGLRVFFEKTVRRPIQLLYLEPICASIVLYNAFTYSLLYILFEAFPIEFHQERGWSQVVGSLPFLAIMVGCFLAGGFNIWYSNTYYAPLVDKAGGKPVPPEYRLPPMMVGATIFPAGLFWFAWTSDPGVHWINSVLSAGLIGSAFLLIFQAGLNYLLDAYIEVAASVVASNTLVRSALAGSLPMAALPFFHNLGVARATTVLAGISCGLAVLPFVFWIYGPKLRSMSRFAISHED